MSTQALIIRTAGTNCDRELAHAFELAGASTFTVHLNQLIEQPSLFEQAQIIGFPGGFSYGDDIAAGRIFANRLRHRLLAPLQDAVRRGTPVIGICNGFQVLVKMGLLPDPQSAVQSATLADNDTGRFTDRWVSLASPADTCCVWTKNLGSLDLPIAHGEGRFVPQSPEVLHQLQERGQIALRYAPPSKDSPLQPQDRHNPNGSIDDIAGICDPSGLVLGLMPHPERFTHPTQHPAWSRRREATASGLQLFVNAVRHVESTLAAASR